MNSLSTMRSPRIPPMVRQSLAGTPMSHANGALIQPKKVCSVTGVATPVTLQTFFGWINAPFAWLMGVPANDCLTIGGILGERIVLNEFIGYLSLTSPNTHVDERSFVLATYALCGFANFSSIAIQVGGIGSLAPERRGDMARLGVRAMIGGLLASYLTATIAGILL